MHNLLLDIGNSDIKAGNCINGKNKVTLLKRFSYSKDNFENDFNKNFKIIKKSNIDKIGISVLNNSNIIFLKKYFRLNYKTDPVFINEKLKLPVNIDNVKGIGNDRICSVSAASEIFKNRNILVIDFGTATTYTLISDKKVKGGVISPGIKTSLDSLISKTSLPKVDIYFPDKILTNNTEDNLRSGVLYQSLFSAERIIKETKKIHKNLYVVATGGFSEIISAQTKLIDATDMNLVLKGVNIILSNL